MILLGTSVTGGRADQICYGAIDITVRRNGYGRQLASFECDLDVGVLGPEPLPAVFIRAPLVESSGDGVEILSVLEPSTDEPDAVSGPGPGAITDVASATPVLCRQGPVLVAAFHPELTADRRVHRLFVSMIEEKGR
jgi:5'-phosphate synthase pdxT subunit